MVATSTASAASSQVSHRSPTSKCERHREERLDRLGTTRGRLQDPLLGDDRGLELVERLREVPDARVLVDVRHRDRREPLAQSRDELRGHEAAPAGVEEVVRRTRHRDPEGRGPPLRHPVPGVGQARRRRCVVVGMRQRPRQRVSVHLPRSAGRDLVDRREQRDQSRGQGVAERVARGGEVQLDARFGHEVADENSRPRRGATHGRGGARHAGQPEQRGVDLTELDASTADLDLVVGPTLEEQAVRLVPDQVAAAVRALPAERLDARVLLRVLDRIEVPRQADAADDQLADLALVHVRPVRSDDGQVPPVERVPDPDRCLARRAGRRTRRPSPPSGRRCSRPRAGCRRAARRARAGTPPRRRSAAGHRRAPRTATARPAWARSR